MTMYDNCFVEKMTEKSFTYLSRSEKLVQLGLARAKVNAREEQNEKHLTVLVTDHAKSISKVSSAENYYKPDQRAREKVKRWLDFQFPGPPSKHTKKSSNSVPFYVVSVNESSMIAVDIVVNPDQSATIAEDSGSDIDGILRLATIANEGGGDFVENPDQSATIAEDSGDDFVQNPDQSATIIAENPDETVRNAWCAVISSNLQDIKVSDNHLQVSASDFHVAYKDETTSIRAAAPRCITRENEDQIEGQSVWENYGSECDLVMIANRHESSLYIYPPSNGSITEFDIDVLKELSPDTVFSDFSSILLVTPPSYHRQTANSPFQPTYEELATISTEYIDQTFSESVDPICINEAETIDQSYSESVDPIRLNDAETVSQTSTNDEVHQKRRSSRWTNSAPETWKKNIRKKKRAYGEKYINSKNATVPEKTYKPGSCKCRFKCTETFTEPDQSEICKSFYQLGDFTRQKDFIAAHIIEEKPKQHSSSEGCRKRKVARGYYLPLNGQKRRVCGDFFCKTLDLKLRGVQKFLDARATNPPGLQSSASSDQRGKHTAHNKTSDWKIELIREHIGMFPCMESHYCRKKTQRKYLDAKLTIKKMYEAFKIFYHQKLAIRQQMGESFTGHSTSVPSELVYRRIFGNEFNLSFFVPKKDQCNICVKYTSSSEKPQLEEVYQAHVKSKNRAQQEKSADKALSIVDPIQYHVVTFDLQSVLQLPSGDVGQLYYKRKLVVYNLTVYGMVSPNDAYCFNWTECDGKKGANEIGSILHKYIMSLPVHTKHVVLFSDSCTGQNRNQYIASILLHTVVSKPNLEIIDHKFLVPGHTHMECDSMHAAIEYAHKNVSIYSIHDWHNVMKSARRSKPYNVQQLFHDDFYDLKKLSEDILTNRTVNVDGETINWLNIRWIRYEKKSPTQLLYKTDFDQPEFSVLNQNRTNKRGRIAKQQNPNASLTQAYKKKFEISAAKREDLLGLCRAGVIPNEFHQFYFDIPAATRVRDKLPGPNIDEDDDDDE